MAIFYDATGPGFGGANGFTNSVNISWLHTATGSNGAVAVGFTSINAGQANAAQTRTVTYGGTNMIQLVTADIATDSFVEIWGLLSPAGGSQTVSVTVSQGVTNTGRQLIGDSVSYSGVSTSGATSIASGTGTAMTQTVASAPGEVIVQAFGALAGQGSYTQTAHYNNIVSGNNADITIGDAPGAASVNFASTCSQPFAWAGVAVRVIPVVIGSNNFIAFCQ